MERILSGDDKIRKAEEIYYRRKRGIQGSKFSKTESDRKSYLGSKILLEILVIINMSIIIMAVQNREYIFTTNFLNDVSTYNVNITKNIKDFIGIENVSETQEENKTLNQTVEEFIEVNPETNSVVNSEALPESVVPNEEAQSSSLSQMDMEIGKIRQLVSIQKPINEGTVTSRFGTRQSNYKNVEGYHTGIDIGATKRYINLCSNFSGQ